MLCFGWTLAAGCQRQTETDRTQYWIQLHTFLKEVLLGLIFVLKRHLSRQMNGGTLDKSAKTSPSASRRVHQLDGKEARLKFKNKRSKNPNPNGQSIEDLRLISNLKLSTSILGNRLFLCRVSRYWNQKIWRKSQIESEAQSGFIKFLLQFWGGSKKLTAPPGSRCILLATQWDVQSTQLNGNHPQWGGGKKYWCTLSLDQQQLSEMWKM